VRSLSQRTEQFNGQIRTLLADINSSINRVDELLESAKSVDSGSRSGFTRKYADNVEKFAISISL
jgi:methyl-accepting chemotaxis protein